MNIFQGLILVLTPNYLVLLDGNNLYISWRFIAPVLKIVTNPDGARICSLLGRCLSKQDKTDQYILDVALAKCQRATIPNK